jgi:8-oxo-dGTP pyrophosphatase MutT (NUDIX family)
MKPEKRTVQFSGRIITLTSDDVLLPNGNHAQLEVVHHPGGAAAVAIDNQNRVCLLRQYRYVAGGWLWELPAGVSARSWETLGTYLSSPGIFTEVLHLFRAVDLEPGQSAHEQAEVIEVHWVPFEEAYRWALDGRISDGKTAIGLIRAMHVDAVRAALLSGQQAG